MRSTRQRSIQARKDAKRQARKVKTQRSKYQAKKPCRALRHKVPGTNIQLLTDTSKMPSYSWGLPAKKACPSMNGGICENCYACKGRYIMQNVVDALQARFMWTVESMRTAAGIALWVSVMVAAIIDATLFEPVFRVHDSGDFFNPAYVRAWIAVCQALPKVQFWFPTRSWQRPVPSSPFVIMTADDLIFREVLKLAALPNVTIRPSALDFGDTAPVIQGLAAGSTAASKGQAIDGKLCIAYSQDGHCGDCRTCWYDRAAPITYPEH